MELKITNEYNGKKTYRLGKLNDDALGMTTKDVVIAEFVFEPRAKKLSKDGKEMLLADCIFKNGNLEEIIPQYMEDSGYGKQISLDISSFSKYIIPKEYEETNVRQVKNDWTMSDIKVEGFAHKTYAFYFVPIVNKEGKKRNMFMMTEINKVTPQQSALLNALFSDANKAKADDDETKVVYGGKVKVKAEDDSISEKRISDILPYYMVMLTEQNKLDTLEFEGE